MGSADKVAPLIVNVLQFVYGTGTEPTASLVDFMNYVRRYKIDLRKGLFVALAKIMARLDRDDASKIIIHKNLEGVDLRQQDHVDMECFTERHDVMILYAVNDSYALQENETFKQMKKRIKSTDLAKYAAYSRDDCVLNVLGDWLDKFSLKATVYSNDGFKDSRKYRHIEPFRLYVYFGGKSYICVFDYKDYVPSRAAVNHIRKLVF
jgi:hypothetical protein